MKKKLISIINVIILLIAIIISLIYSTKADNGYTFDNICLPFLMTSLMICSLTSLNEYIRSKKRGHLFLLGNNLAAICLCFFYKPMESLLLLGCVIALFIAIILIILPSRQENDKPLPPLWVSNFTYTICASLSFLFLFCGIYVAFIVEKQLTNIIIVALISLLAIVLCNVVFALIERYRLNNIYRKFNKDLDIKKVAVLYKLVLQTKNLNDITKTYIDLRLAKIYFAYGDIRQSSQLFDQIKIIDPSSSLMYYEVKASLNIKISTDYKKGIKILEDGLKYCQNIRSKKNKEEMIKKINLDIKLIKMLYNEEKTSNLLLPQTDYSFDNLALKIANIKINKIEDKDLETRIEGLYLYKEILKKRLN